MAAMAPEKSSFEGKRYWFMEMFAIRSVCMCVCVCVCVCVRGKDNQ